MDMEATIRIVAIVLAVAAALTLIPSPGASKACLIGYKAKCSFAPISTAILGIVSGALFIIRTIVFKG